MGSVKRLMRTEPTPKDNIGNIEMKLTTKLNMNAINKMSAEILDLNHKMIDLQIHYRVNLEESIESFNNGDYVDNFDLIEGLFYDMFDIKATVKNHLDRMNKMVEDEPELLNYITVTPALKRAEEDFKMICDMYEDVLAQMDTLYGLEAHLVNEEVL